MPVRETQTGERRRLTIFRGADAETLHESGMMESRFASDAQDGLRRMYDAGLSAGSVVQCLFRSPDPEGFSLTYAWFKPNYALPLHSHNSDCLYYIVSGSLQLGDHVLSSGDGFFLPGGTPYAYQAGVDGVEVLEFRDRTLFDIHIGAGSPRAWERLVQICRDNGESWRAAALPKRAIAPPRGPTSR